MKPLIICGMVMVLADILEEPVRKYVIRDIVKLGERETVVKAAEAMKENSVESVIIVDERGAPVGILTEKDILYRVVAEGRNPAETRLTEVASKPLITVSPEITVGQAISLMLSHDIRRVPVVEKGRLVGVVVMREVIGDLVRKATPIPDVEVPEGIRCPFCGSIFTNRETLSKHIDRVHIGGGLFRGLP